MKEINMLDLWKVDVVDSTKQDKRIINTRYFDQLDEANVFVDKINVFTDPLLPYYIRAKEPIKIS